MTRETKIGLLVGLVFIIVVGILLSENFHGASELPQAALDHAGASARLAVSVPGVTPVAPPAPAPAPDSGPRSRVAVPRDLDTPVPPVTPTDPQGVIRTPVGIDPELANTALRQGVPLVPVGDTGTITGTHPDPLHNATRSYTAGPGDTVSKLATRFLGANTKSNRDLIIAANASLRDNPNKIIVGQSYDIPAPAPRGTVPQAQQAPAPVIPMAAARWTYTVKSNDTLWGIANTQLGDPNSVDAIKELNRDTLKGGTVVRAGMKLTLPARPLASVN